MDGRLIYETTLCFLGGKKRLELFLGAKNFTFDSNTGCATFHFEMCDKADIVSFELTQLDEYKITFFKSHNFDVEIVKVFDGVYNNQLVDLFEDYTGLYLSL